MSQFQVLANNEHLTDKYTPCNSLSVFHDLKCGHRIEVKYARETCGTNCKVHMPGKSFACPGCLVHDVRLEMMFEGLDISIVGEDVVMEEIDMSRKDKIQEIAKIELQKLLEQGHRGCIIAPKLNDPTLQFFDQFLKEDGFAGINEEPCAALGVGYRRPHQRVRLDANDGEQYQLTEEDFKAEWERLEGLEQGNNELSQSVPSVESVIDDEATDAVRNTLSSYTLVGSCS